MLRAKEQRRLDIRRKFSRLKSALFEWKSKEIDDERAFNEVMMAMSDVIQETSGLTNSYGKPRAHCSNWDDIKQHILLLFIVNKERLRGTDLENPYWRSYITRAINMYYLRGLKGTKKVYENTNSAGYSYNYTPQDANQRRVANMNRDGGFVFDEECDEFYFQGDDDVK